MSGLPKSLNHFIEKRSPVTTPLSAIDHEQSPDVTRLMVCAGKTLNLGVVLGNKENRLVQIPRDFRGRNERRILGGRFFSRSMPHLGNPRQVDVVALRKRGNIASRLCPCGHA